MPKNLLQKNRSMMLEYTNMCIDELHKTSDCDVCEKVGHHVETLKIAISILIENEKQYVDTIEQLYLQLQSYEGN